uniref:Uncharacterized protein n=1 Tax=Anguilla anguilla TaxID=7936 RepID=A0A0E9Q0C4_ANGAN
MAHDYLRVVEQDLTEHHIIAILLDNYFIVFR